MTSIARAIVTSTVAALLAAGCTTGDDPGPPVPVDPGVIYAQMCARCHGTDGRGDAEIKKTLPVRNFHDPAFQAKARDNMRPATLPGHRPWRAR